MLPDARAMAQSISGRGHWLAGNSCHRDLPERVVFDPSDGIDGLDLWIFEQILMRVDRSMQNVDFCQARTPLGGWPGCDDRCDQRN